MNKSQSNWCWKLGLVSALGISGVFTFFGNSALAQIIKDNTLGSESSVVTHEIINNQPTDQIDGGTIRGTNLFHSFERFSVPAGSTAYFNNDAANIQNIISRVTGKSISNIDGILKANGKANLFLINPNGIIFGSNASLNIGGSFMGSTGSSLNFADGTKFSATDPEAVPLLTVSIPIGLQFGATAAPIRNQSQANPDGVPYPVGLQVRLGKTLALVGGDITLEGGNLTAPGGRIELGSVTANSLVSLNSTNQSWILGYENVQNFQNIQLIQRQTVNGTGVSSQVDASGDGGGNIQVQGNTVELIGNLVGVTTRPTATGNGGNLTINTRKLIIRDGAQVYTSSLTEGNGGNLTVNASESVELIGGFFSPNIGNQPSSLFSSTGFAGKAGDITINTRRLYIQDGANISTETLAKRTLVNSQFQFIPATGAGGNLTVNASESVELIGTSVNRYPSGLFATTNGSGDAGKVTISTGKLIIRDGAGVTVNSQIGQGYTYPKDRYILGKAGDLKVTASSILLDNQGSLTSNSESGKGGNISLQVRDLLLMRHNSQITTNAGGNGDGGNITINASNGFVVAPPFGNSDITANAFSGSGGKITITTKNIFGFVPRTGAEVEKLDPTGKKNPNNLPTNDITAFSQQNSSLNGTVQINSPDADPSRGLVELPVNLVDASQQIVADCNSGAKIARSSFIRTGRGGLIADPTQPLIADDAVLADWITLSPESQNHVDGIPKRAVVQAQRNTEKKSQKVNSVNEPTQIVEAQGWVIDANGNVVLVDQVPTATPHNSWLNTASCAAK